MTGAWTFGLLAGTLLETTPYFVFQSGRVQLLWLGALPLALAGVHCLALGRHQRKAMIGLALAVVLAWGSCVYYAVLLTPLIMVVIFLYATSGLVSNRLSFLIRAGSSLFLGLALMSQELWAYSRISTNFGFLRKIYLFRSSPLWRYVHLEPDRWVFWGDALAHTPAEGEKVLFPGVILLGLVAASLIFLTALFFRRAAAWIRVLARERGKGCPPTRDPKSCGLPCSSLLGSWAFGCSF